MKIIGNAVKEGRVKRSKDAEDYVYYEAHHILPKSLFPAWSNRKSNIVLLTAREHFFCHQLLTKTYRSSSMTAAFWRMVNCGQYKVTSREYERIKTEFSKVDTLLNNKRYENGWLKKKPITQNTRKDLLKLLDEKTVLGGFYYVEYKTKGSKTLRYYNCEKTFVAELDKKVVGDYQRLSREEYIRTRRENGSKAAKVHSKPVIELNTGLVFQNQKKVVQSTLILQRPL